MSRSTVPRGAHEVNDFIDRLAISAEFVFGVDHRNCAEQLPRKNMEVTQQQAERVLEAVKSQIGGSQSSNEEQLEKEHQFLCIATAARYLRGYKTEAKTIKQMLSTHEYRQLLHADTVGTGEQTYQTVWKELTKRHMFLGAISDHATPSSPVLVMRKKAEAFDKDDFEDYRQTFFFTLACAAHVADRELALQDPLLRQTGQWVLVMDMSGYSSKNSPPFNVSMETLRIFQNHFPERAKRIIVLDAPIVFNALWRVLKSFIDPVTRPKFVFLSRSIGEEALRQEVGDAVWDCINVDLEEGKKRSSQFMVDAGLLRPK